MITAKDVPHFTGDLEQVEQHASGLRTHAGALRQAGSVAHSKFQGLGAFYRAPEAEELFASTAPVRDRADLFASKVETVAGALDDYVGAVRPIIARLDRLRTRVATFVAGLKTDGGEIDDEWTQDQDKIDQHDALWDEIGQAQADFTAAETAANNKITALVGGPQYVPQGYEGTLVPLGARVYGYTAEALKHADKLPWGTPEALTYDKFDITHHVEDAGVSVKDNIVGTVTGLVDLVSPGEDGDAARKGLGMSVLGLESYLFDPLNKQDSPWKEQAAEGRPYAKTFAKSLVGWDDWADRPGKATGTVFFNGLTLASGPLAAVSKMAKGGAVAKTAGALAKVGEAIDPISATAKTVGATTRAIPKIADVTARARAGFNNVPDAGSTSTVWRFAPGSELHVRSGELVILKNGVPDTTPPRVELSADERTPSVEAPREHQLVGAGARAPEASAHAGENLPPQASHGPPPGGGGGRHGAEGANHPTGPAGAHASGPTASEVGPIRPSGGDHSGRGGGGHGANSGGRGGAADRLSEAEKDAILRRQVEKANTDPQWRKDHYYSSGRRRSIELRDEHGDLLQSHLLPTGDPARPWTAATPTVKPDYLPGKEVGHVSTLHPDHRPEMHEMASQRRYSIDYDQAAERFKRETSARYEQDNSLENELAKTEAIYEYKSTHTHMGISGENLGEYAAEFHAIPDHFQVEKRLDDGARGQHRFDQIWRTKDGRIVVVEAKADVGTELNRKRIGSRYYSQGTREYFDAILLKMEDRGEIELADELSRALDEGRLDYVEVKAQSAGDKYNGYVMRYFDISRKPKP
ncbi:hypothetical protein ACFWY6_09100 [Streptomyces sp. NPDC059037]|uniref:hypothetical protein n=1 Tax=Streptomyces sp. NPDC059037 TaxID=3346710 RepID=UPI0036AEF6D1